MYRGSTALAIKPRVHCKKSPIGPIINNSSSTFCMTSGEACIGHLDASTGVLAGRNMAEAFA